MCVIPPGDKMPGPDPTPTSQGRPASVRQTQPQEPPMDQGQQSPTPAELQQQVDALRQQVAALRTELDVERQNRAFVVTVENEVVSGAGSYLQTTIRELVGDLLVSLK